MTLANLIDTILNVGVFAFIGLLVYLWLKETPDEREGAPDRPDER